MKTAGFFLRVSLCSLLFEASCGMHFKGSKSHQQSGGDGSAGGSFASYQGASTGRSAPVLYNAPRLVSAPVFVQDASPHHDVGYTTPLVSSLDSTAPAVGYYVGSGSAMPLQTGAVTTGFTMPLQTGAVSSGSAVPLQTGAVSSGSAVPLQTGAVSSGSAMPIQTGAVSSGSAMLLHTGAVSSGSAMPLQTGAVSFGSAMPLQTGAVGTASVVPLQPGYVVSGSAVPFQAGAVGPGPAGAETQWAVPPQSLTEAADDAQTMGASDFLLPAPLTQPEPSFQAGEASSVTKEAELGNFQQQTEEFGYPADKLGQGQQGFTSVVVPQFGVAGFSAYPYPYFDYNLLYGLYPPGTQTTFSQHHEKGKDYSQAIHYLKEHASDNHGSVQQKKVFQAAS